MYKVILVTHNNLGESLLSTAQMFCGKQDDVITLGLYEEDSSENLAAKFINIMKEFEGDDILVLTDIVSGTPFNIVVESMRDYSFQHISGVNLAVCVEAIISKNTGNISEVVDTIVQQHPMTFMYVNQLIEREGMNE